MKTRFPNEIKKKKQSSDFSQKIVCKLMRV